MASHVLDFNIGGARSRVFIQDDFPAFADIARESGGAAPETALALCDEHTRDWTAAACPGAALCVLPPGEREKNWASVERALAAAHAAGLGRDALFVGVGGGVITDMAAFAASIYMRRVRLALVSTTLLGMADAALGGKTGIDLFGIKNLAGTFYPARAVWMPLRALAALPAAQWKSGFAEIIKTALLDGPRPGALERFERLAPYFRAADFSRAASGGGLAALLAEAVAFKGRVVEADPHEEGGGRVLLNLGHTFGHALEASAGLGALTHGEAVAWGIARACVLGRELGVTPPGKAREITALLDALGYETAAPHPAARSPESFMAALAGDKKKRGGSLRFIVPAGNGARAVTLPDIGLARRAALEGGLSR